MVDIFFEAFSFPYPILQYEPYFSARKLFDEYLSLYLGGLRAILTDQNKLVVAVGGVTALAAGIYTTRYINYVNQLNIFNSSFYSSLETFKDLLDSLSLYFGSPRFLELMTQSMPLYKPSSVLFLVGVCSCVGNEFCKVELVICCYASF